MVHFSHGESVLYIVGVNAKVHFFTCSALTFSKLMFFCLNCLQENTDGSLVPVPVRILNIVTQSGRPNLNLGDADSTNDILVHRFLMCDAVSGRESGPGGAGEAYLDGTGYLRVIRWAAHLAVQAVGVG